jgi:hypothetical protein
VGHQQRLPPGLLPPLLPGNQPPAHTHLTRSFVKALFRSAAACSELGKLLEARQHLLRAARLQPANREVRRPAPDPTLT